MKIFVILILISCFGFPLTKTCMSIPEHPEVLYCKADFVIKILVGSHKYVYLEEDGSFVEAEQANEEGQRGPPETPDRTEVEDSGTTVSEEIPPALYPPEPILSNGGLEEGEEDVDSENPAIELSSSDENSTSLQNPANEQPEEEEEAEAAPEDGRLINWPGIRTGHSTGNKVNSFPIGVSVSNNQGNSPKSDPATIVDDGDVREREISENAEEPERAAAARRGRYAAMSFASAVQAGYAVIGPNGAMPGSNNHFVGVHGAPVGMRSSNGSPGKHSRRRRKGKRNLSFNGGFERSHLHRRYKRNAASAGLLVPDDVPQESNLHPGVLMMQYSIAILKVFKGEVDNSTQYLYTPPNGGLCIMTLKRKTPYIVMGRFHNELLRIDQSDYKIDLTELDSAEMKHLTNNMKHRYSKGCKDCYIKVCNPSCAQQIPDANQCLWRNMYSVMNAKASQFACIRKKKGICDWVNSREPHMRPEDLN